MPTYTQIVDYSVKDGLITGDPNKLVRGTEIDAELAAIATAIGEAQDDVGTNTANGLLLLDGNGRFVQAQMLLTPEISTLALTNAAGAPVIETKVDITTSSRRIWDVVDRDNSDALRWRWSTLSTEDLRLTAFEGAAGAETSNQVFDVVNSTGEVQFAVRPTQGGINLARENRDLIAGTGLTGGGTLEANRTFNLDISGLTAYTSSDIASSDGVLIDDAGVMKRMQWDDMGIRVQNFTSSTDFGAGAVNSLQLLTGTTNRTRTIRTNATIPIEIGAILYVGSRDTATLTISPEVGVTLTNVLRSGNLDTDVSAGGIAAIIKVATDEWMIVGDIV